jgi:sensor histidine kinase YesM
MTTIRLPFARFGPPLAGGFRVSWRTLLVIATINTGIAGLLWVEDPRQFWHPLVSAQCFGFAIAYCVNVASPWEKSWPVARLIGAVASGTVVGMLLVILVKRYQLDHLFSEGKTFALTMAMGFINGLFFGLFFLIKFREARAATALHKAEAERHLLSKQAVESELKLMQAQVEPHFLFNTLASVQYLVETDPPQASKMLGHLLAYLRAAVPQLRLPATTLGKEIELAEAYLSIFRMRMGERLAFVIDVPGELRAHAFPPMLLMTVVENAIEHGLEPRAEGGSVTLAARRDADALVVTVTDTGTGLAGRNPSRPGHGVGVANLHDRLAAMHGPRGRFRLEDVAPHGARATIEIPFQAG